MSTIVQSIGGVVSVQGWYTVIVALLNVTSVMSSVHFGFGQSGAPGIGVTGPAVSTLQDRFPFLISLPGMASTPVSTASAGFCPGGWVSPAGLVHAAVGCPVATTVMTTSPFPKPASFPEAFRNSPISLNTGEPFLKCTFAARAACLGLEPRPGMTRTLRTAAPAASSTATGIHWGRGR